MNTCWWPFQHLLAWSCWETPSWESIDCCRFQLRDVTRGNSHLQYLWNSSPVTSREGECEDKWRGPLLGGAWTDTMIALLWDGTLQILAWERSMVNGTLDQGAEYLALILGALILGWLWNFLKLHVVSSINKEVKGENYQPLLKWKKVVLLAIIRSQCPQPPILHR